MRLSIAAVAMTASLCAGAAYAQATPAEVKIAGGAMTDGAGKPLYIWDNDTMVGMSHCEGRCATVWPPLTAPAAAKPMGAWTLITRGDGTKQWAYHDKPVYTYAKDEAGKPGTGEAVTGWKLAK